MTVTSTKVLNLISMLPACAMGTGGLELLVGQVEKLGVWWSLKMFYVVSQHLAQLLGDSITLWTKIQSSSLKV